MFDGGMITLFVFLMFVSILLASYFEKRNAKLKNIIVFMTLLEGIYFILAGLYMSIGWTNSETWLTTNRWDHIGTPLRKNGGIYIYQFWPYILIGLGGFLSYTCIKVLCGKGKVDNPEEQPKIVIFK